MATSSFTNKVKITKTDVNRLSAILSSDRKITNVKKLKNVREVPSEELAKYFKGK